MIEVKLYSDRKTFDLSKYYFTFIPTAAVFEKYLF